MHRESYNAVTEFKNIYIGKHETGYKILDVGGKETPSGTVPGIGGNYENIFPGCTFHVLDFKTEEEGSRDSVPDIIVNGYDWPIDDETYDVVLCGQVFEHDKFFWLTLNNIKRVLKKDGLACIVAPSTGGVHRHPIDCYRFFEDSMTAFAEYMNMELLDVKTYESYFNDVRGVFKKSKG